jgi:protein-disulfide isomerase
MKNNKFLIFIYTLLIIGLFSIFLLTRTHIEKNNNKNSDYSVVDPSKPYKVYSDKTDIIVGDKSAPITVYAFLSYTCPHCQWFDNTQFPIVNKEYIDTNKVKFVFKSFPLNLPALQASSVIQCLPEDKRFQAQQSLFANFNDWVSKWSNSETGFTIIEDTIGLSKEDQEKVTLCSNTDSNLKLIVDEEKKYEKIYGINGTPTFFIGQYKVSGSIKAKDMENLIDKAEK